MNKDDIEDRPTLYSDKPWSEMDLFNRPNGVRLTMEPDAWRVAFARHERPK
jgi:hypothetical protein